MGNPMDINSQQQPSFISPETSIPTKSTGKVSDEPVKSGSTLIKGNLQTQEQDILESVATQNEADAPVSSERQAQLDKTFPDSPLVAPPQEGLASMDEADLTFTMAASQAVTEIMDHIDAELVAIVADSASPGDEGQPLTNTETATVPTLAEESAAASPASPTGAGPLPAPTNRFLAGTQYVALKVAVSEFVKQTMQLDILMDQQNRDLRKAELANVNDQVGTIKDEGKRKQDLMMSQAITKVVTSGLSIVGHGLAGKGSSTSRVAATNFQTKMQTINGLINNAGEATSKFLEAGAQTDLAGYDAKKVVQRDLYQNIQGARQKAQGIVDNNKNDLAKALENLTELFKTSRTSNQVTRG